MLHFNRKTPVCQAKYLQILLLRQNKNHRMRQTKNAQIPKEPKRLYFISAVRQIPLFQQELGQQFFLPFLFYPVCARAEVP